MTMDRRQFLKAGMAVLGTAAMGNVLGEEGSKAEAAGPAPQYEIFCCKYGGPNRRNMAMVLHNKGWDQEVENNLYLWAIKGKDEFILVDTGAGLKLPHGWKTIGGYVNPLEVLARIGVKASNVNKVIITHMHWDHVGGMQMFPEAFPDAKFYVQKKEFDFWVKNPVAKRPYFEHVADPLANKIVAELEGTDRLIFVSGDQKFIPGIEFLLTRGHTPSNMSVVVNTAKGTAIVASDCFHNRRAFLEDNTSIFIYDAENMLKSYDRLRAKASAIDLVFGGHDKFYNTEFPKVAEDVTRLV